MSGNGWVYAAGMILLAYVFGGLIVVTLGVAFAIWRERRASPDRGSIRPRDEGPMAIGAARVR